MKKKEDIQQTIEIYGDMIFRICICRLKTKADSEDAFQDVFLKYANTDTVFDSPEHKKSWLIRVTMNICNDYLRKSFWKRNGSLEEMVVEPMAISEEDSKFINIIRTLPGKYQEVLIMHYYEGYSAVEIGQILNKNVNTIYSLLKRGREQLKRSLGGDLYE